MTRVVLDASVVVAAVLKEPGGDRAVGHKQPPMMSAVNYAEVRSRLTDLGLDAARIDDALALFDLDVIDFDKAQAGDVAELRRVTRLHGLSLGDRACLALAIRKDAEALTADRVWARIDLPVDVCVVR